MPFHLIGAKQFRPQRWRIADVRCQAIAAQARPQTGPGVAYAFTAQFHFRFPFPSRSSGDPIAVTAMGCQFFVESIADRSPNL
jgi:hypothetical protein